MNVPDYISAIAAHRVWQWDTTGLKSLNGEPWSPGKPLAAECRAASHAEAAHAAHDAPQANCTCGVYASKSFEHLRTTGYARYGIHGEVNLWGTVVEHEQGWRAEFAYPKTLYMSSEMLPVTLKEIQIRIQALVRFGCDLFIAHETSNVPLWRKASGLDANGMTFLISRGEEWYARRTQDRTLKTGDRIAVLCRGIGVVERVGDKEVHAVLWNRSMLRIERKDIVWDESNMRWEAQAQSSVVEDCRSI